MAIRRRTREANRKTKDSRGDARVKMKMHGLPIAIPAELDLPAGAPFEGRDQPTTMHIPQDIQELFGPLVEMATNAWRLQARMVDRDSGEPKAETRKLYRFVEGLFRALDEAGIQVIDKTGKPYDNGMSEKVISFEQTPGLLKEHIIETVRPSIRWKEQPLYHGEIIVGIPVIEIPPEETPTSESAPAPCEAATESTQTADAAESPPVQGEESPDSEENESLDTPESDAVAYDKQPVATQADSGSDQPETAISENPSGQDAKSDLAEDESAPMEPADAQDKKHSVGPDTPEQSKTPEQAEKE